MTDGDDRKPESWIILILGLMALGTIVLEIVYARDSLTSLESTLFSILQFIFSVGFAWSFARASSRREFARSQKQFALSAFRRIKEIEKAVDRMLGRVAPSRRSDSPERDIIAVREIAKGIRESIASSIADWGDIIGEEIVVVERIEAIREESKTSSDVSEKVGPSRVAGMIEGLREETEEVRGLLEKLPYSLRIMSEETDNQRVQYWERLKKEIEENDGVKIGCYADEEVHTGLIVYRTCWADRLQFSM